MRELLVQWPLAVLGQNLQGSCQVQRLSERGVVRLHRRMKAQSDWREKCTGRKDDGGSREVVPSISVSEGVDSGGCVSCCQASREPVVGVRGEVWAVVGPRFEAGVTRVMIDRVIEMMSSSSHMQGDMGTKKEDFMYRDDGGALMRTRVTTPCSETMTALRKPSKIMLTMSSFID